MNTPWHQRFRTPCVHECIHAGAMKSAVIWWVDQNSLRFEMHSPSIGKDRERQILPNSMPRATIRETRKTAWFDALACMNFFFLRFSLYELTELLQYKGRFIYLSQGYVRNTWWLVATKGMTWSNHFVCDSSFLDALPYVCRSLERLSPLRLSKQYNIFWSWNKIRHLAGRE
jgi:hypothetical protein